MRYYFITTDTGLGKGGIQTWAHYIEKFFKTRNLPFGMFCLKKATVRSLLNLVKANVTNNVIVLMDWQKLAFVPLSLLLSYMGIIKSRYIVFILGNEILSRSRIKILFLKMITRRNDIYFVSDSGSIADIFHKKFKRKIDLVCYTFIDTRTDVQPRADTPEKKERRILFTVSRLVKRKNVENVIRALQPLMRKYTDLRYFIGGDGPERGNLESAISSLDLSDRVVLLGQLTEERKMEYLKNSDLYILPSVFDEDDGSIEGFGIVFIEANMYGVPVISGNTGGMPEAVVDGVTGFHTDGSIPDITKKIEKALGYNFDTVKILKHAAKFDYREQESFYKFITHI